jgi:hypothetical protein
MPIQFLSQPSPGSILLTDPLPYHLPTNLKHYHPQITNLSATKQSSIKKWAAHTPFISNVPSSSSSTSIQITSEYQHPTNPRQHYSTHLSPFGMPLPLIDPTKTLRVCIQNTQHDFKLYGDGLELSSIMEHLQTIGSSMFVPVSPNVNWKNHSNGTHTRQIFRPHFNQVHLSTVSSDIGLHLLYLNKRLVGGTAIVSFGLWASNIIPGPLDDSGYVSFSITTIQGKGN